MQQQLREAQWGCAFDAADEHVAVLAQLVTQHLPELDVPRLERPVPLWPSPPPPPLTAPAPAAADAPVMAPVASSCSSSYPHPPTHVQDRGVRSTTRV